MKKQPKRQVAPESPSGTWLFECIQQCEFAEKTWTPDQVFAVPAGTEVPAKAFKEIGRLPYVSASLEAEMPGKKSPTGTWFLKCIRECEFAEKVWKQGEEFVVPAGTEVPKGCFQEIERERWLPRVDSGRSGERCGAEMAGKKSPTGTWFFKCIQQCEFEENVWEPDEVIAVPAGTEVPKEGFQEIERLPYVSASLEIRAYVRRGSRPVRDTHTS